MTTLGDRILEEVTLGDSYEKDHLKGVVRSCIPQRGLVGDFLGWLGFAQARIPGLTITGNVEVDHFGYDGSYAISAHVLYFDRVSNSDHYVPNVREITRTVHPILD